MIAVRIVGGLGNQMFQYALFRKYLEMGLDVYYEPFEAREHNGFELENVFNIVKKRISSLEEAKKLIRYGEKNWPVFSPEILNVKEGYVEGNWQNTGYFPNDTVLRKDFTFIKELDQKNKNILNDINNSNSVSIHVRRTDYTKMPGYFFQADWMNYYGMAVAYLVKNTKSSSFSSAYTKPLKFFVFSDDIAWCKRNFMINATFVENTQKDGWKDMLLMSKCKHNIIANSTFSWWGAWLNENPNKIITAPKNWVANVKTDLITPKEWITL